MNIEKLEIINIGAKIFYDDLIRQNVNVTYIDWKPPIKRKPEVDKALNYLLEDERYERINKANKEAVNRIINSHPVLIGYKRAIDVIPGMTKDTILHAGPPVKWENMCGAMKGAITGAIIFEGLAPNLDEAYKLAESGKIKFSPCHEHNTVGSMAGVTSASMYVHIVKNKTYGNIAYTNLSEQLAKILRMGANDESVIKRLIWMRDVFGPILSEAMELAKEIDLRLMLSQALHMGDEAHNRNNVGTLLLIQKLSPYILQTSFSIEQKKEVLEFVALSDYFSGPTWMAVSKCALDAGHNVKDSTILTTMCRNGYEFGIRVSNFEGFKWFTEPAQQVIGPMFAGFKPEDSGLDIGDSAITETYGLGGFAMAAAPAIVPLVGGTVEEAINYSKEMVKITTALNPHITIPILNFRGLAVGIDVIKVIETGILPVINTAIAHKDAGIGMIGAGIVNPPMEVFEKAIIALKENIE